MTAGKRLNYFRHQLLDESDFRDEQMYHVESRRRHNRLLHTPGIATGFTVVQDGPHQIVVNPGTAFDGDGREIALADAEPYNLSHQGPQTDLWVTIRYDERPDETDRRTSHG